VTVHRSTYCIRFAVGVATALLAATGQAAVAADKHASCSTSFDDSSADVEVATVVNGTPTPLAPADNPDVDLTKVTISRDARNLRVVFQVTKLAAEPVQGSPFGAWNLAFSAGGHRYAVHSSGDNPLVNAGTYYGWFGFHALRDDKQVRGATGRFDTTTSTVVVEWPDRSAHGTLSRVHADSNAVVFNGGAGPAIVRTQQQDTATGSRLALDC
jgi:hypothetical protein